MAQGTVTSHKGGTVLFQIPYVAAVASYNIYSSRLGPNVSSQMLFAVNIANVNSGGGLSKFQLLEGQLGITNPLRDWYIRIVEVDGSGNELATLESIPGTHIPISTSDELSIKQTTSAGNFNGTPGNGYLSFSQISQIIISRIEFHLVNSAYTLSIIDAAGNAVVLSSDSGTGTTDKVILGPIPLQKGEVLAFVTTTPGNHMIKVTRAP